MNEITDFTACAAGDCDAQAEASCTSSDCGCSTTRCTCLNGHLVYVIVRSPGCWRFQAPPPDAPTQTFGNPT